MTSATVLRAQQSNQNLSINLPTTENTNRSFVPKGKLTLAVYGRQVEDAFLKNKQGVSVINPEFEASYNDYLTLGLEFAALIGTGNTSNFWSEEGKAPSSILLTEAFAKVNFHENVFFRVGALETTINPISSIMSSMTFLGAQEEWQVGAKESNITLSAYQSVPSSGSVSKNLYDDGSTAYFFSETISGKFKSQTTGTEIKVAATRFQFENLSTNVATESSLLGNSLESFEGLGKAFRYKIGFMGTETAASLNQELGSVEIGVRGSSIVNDQAPEGYNKGKQVGVHGKLTLGNYVFKAFYSQFDYQADVTPATYSLITSRYQNRKGQKLGFDVELKKEKLALRTMYVDLKEKEINPYLANRAIYNILLEAKYDLF